MSKTVAIIGAGPAGLTAALELLRLYGDKYKVIVLEQEHSVGGLAKTVGNDKISIDIGGHRYFSKNPQIIRWWESVLPSGDLLTVKRSSKILFNSRLVDYPVTLSKATFQSVGFKTGVDIVTSYLRSRFSKSEIKSLRDFYVNRFGQKLYELFFETYTEKVWGRKPERISADWGHQRIQNFSLKDVLNGILLNKRNSSMARTLADSFYYPRYGSGYIWECVADNIRTMGGQILLNTSANELILRNERVHKIKCQSGIELLPDYVISSMPLPELFAALSEAPPQLISIAGALEYRDFIIVGLSFHKRYILSILHERDGIELIDDQWIYVQDAKVRIGRIQIIDNWSPCLSQSDDHICLGIEFFCNKDEPLWSMGDALWVDAALNELRKLHLIAKESTAAAHTIYRAEKAYPCYWGAYSSISALKCYIDSIENLICIGRNGQHRYNNMDHSMETAFRAAQVIDGSLNKSAVWDVNIENEYHEGFTSS